MKIIVIALLSVYLYFVLHNFLVLFIISMECQHRLREEYPELAQYKPPRISLMYRLQSAMPYFVPILHAMLAYHMLFYRRDITEGVYQQLVEVMTEQYNKIKEGG